METTDFRCATAENYASFSCVDDAFDTFRNQRVRALAATMSRFPDHYICPFCRTEVALISGPVNRKHFRHVRGTDHEECERYSKNFGRDVPLSQHEHEHLDAVLVASRSPDEDGGRVTFAVRFRPAIRTGRVKLTGHVEFVFGRQSMPYTIQPTRRQQYFRITAPEKSYLIKAKLSDGGQAQYPVEGFDSSPAVFRATQGEAVRIPAHRFLKPGAHVVVTRKPALSDFHTSLAACSVPTLAGLHAALIQIPENASWQVRENVKSTLGFDIAWRLATYGFLNPGSAYEIGPDCWEVPRDSELAIFVRTAIEFGPRFTRLLVQHRESGHLVTDYLPLNTNHSEFVLQLKPGSRRPDLLRVGLWTSAANPVSFLFEINFSDDALLPQCARIQFQFVTTENANVRLKWSAHELPKMLMDAASGSAKLLAVKNTPDSVELVASDSRGQRVTIPQAGSAEKLMSFLKEGRFPLNISASGHPDIVLTRKKIIVDNAKLFPISIRLIPRCRREARLRDAFERGFVSEYAVQALKL